MSLIPSVKPWVPAVFFDGEKERDTPFQFQIAALNLTQWGLYGHGRYHVESVIEQIENWAKRNDLFEKGQTIIFDVKGSSKIVFTAIPHISKNLLKLNNKNNNNNKNKNNSRKKRVKNREKELEGLFNNTNNKLSNREEELKNLFKGGKTKRVNKKTRKAKKKFFGLF